LAFVYESRIDCVSGANSRSEAEQVARNMELFAGATGVGPIDQHARPHLPFGLAHVLQNCLFALRAAGGFVAEKRALRNSPGRNQSFLLAIALRFYMKRGGRFEQASPE
jgi:hypothetical protein